MAKEYEVTVVNPKRKRRRRKSTPPPAPRKRRRRSPAANPAPRRRSYARRNPSILGVSFDWSSTTAQAGLRLLGKVAGAFMVRLIGNDGENQISGGMSETTGARWTFFNHVLNILGGMAGGALVNMLFKNRNLGKYVLEGAIDQSMQKAFWSEIVHRFEAGPKWLGAAEGDVREDGRGGTFIYQGGQWIPMLGLREKSALGGYRGAAAELDGLEYASALGRVHRRRPMGHLMSPDVPAETASSGKYTRSGYVSPYHSAYM